MNFFLSSRNQLRYFCFEFILTKGSFLLSSERMTRMGGGKLHDISLGLMIGALSLKEEDTTRKIQKNCSYETHILFVQCKVRKGISSTSIEHMRHDAIKFRDFKF